MSKRNTEVSGYVEPKRAASLARRAFQEGMDLASGDFLGSLGPRLIGGTFKRRKFCAPAVWSWRETDRW